MSKLMKCICLIVCVFTSLSIVSHDQISAATPKALLKTITKNKPGKVEAAQEMFMSLPTNYVEYDLLNYTKSKRKVRPFHIQEIGRRHITNGLENLKKLEEKTKQDEPNYIAIQASIAALTEHANYEFAAALSHQDQERLIQNNLQIRFAKGKDEWQRSVNKNIRFKTVYSLDDYQDLSETLPSEFTQQTPLKIDGQGNVLVLTFTDSVTVLYKENNKWLGQVFESTKAQEIEFWDLYDVNWDKIVDVVLKVDNTSATTLKIISFKDGVIQFL